MASGLLLNRFASVVLRPLKRIGTTLPSRRLPTPGIGHIHPKRFVPRHSIPTVEDDIMKYGPIGIGLLSLSLAYMAAEYHWKKPRLLAEIEELNKAYKAASDKKFAELLRRNGVHTEH